MRCALLPTAVLDLDANRTPVPPKDAATVVVVRPVLDPALEEEDAPGALEVFCVERHKKSGFLGGAVVFPGGKVEPSDGEPRWRAHAARLHPRVADLVSEAASAQALVVAAARETLEEAGILPAEPPLDEAGVDAMRREMAERGQDLFLACKQRGLRLALERLLPFSRWVTPEAEQKRFDARFFLLPCPAGQEGRHDDHETTHSFWAPPRRVLERFFAGEIMLAPPTLRLLELLADVSGVDGAVALAERQCLDPICPTFFLDGDVPTLSLPGDPAHACRDRRIDGPTRFVLDDGKFVSRDVASPA